MQGKHILIFLASVYLMLSSCGNTKLIDYEQQIATVLDSDNNYLSPEKAQDVFNIIRNIPNIFEYEFIINEDSDVNLPPLRTFSKSEINKLGITESNDGKVKAFVLKSDGFDNLICEEKQVYTLIVANIEDSIQTYEFHHPGVIVEIANIEGDNYIIITQDDTVTYGVRNNAYVYKIDAQGISELSQCFEKNHKYENNLEVLWNGKSPQFYQRDEENVDDYSEYELDFGILYNWMDQTLYISKVDNAKSLTRTFSRLKWENHYFKDVTLMETFEIRNDDYYISIEQNEDGKLTYRSWRGGNKIGLPNLTMINGKREICGFENSCKYDEWVCLDESSPLGEIYTFKNDGYTYEYRSGWFRGEFNDLSIYDPSDNIIYEKGFVNVKRPSFE